MFGSSRAADIVYSSDDDGWYVLPWADKAEVSPTFSRVEDAWQWAVDQGYRPLYKTD